MFQVCADGERALRHRKTYDPVLQQTKIERQNCVLAVWFDGERRALRVVLQVAISDIGRVDVSFCDSEIGAFPPEDSTCCHFFRDFYVCLCCRS